MKLYVMRHGPAEDASKGASPARTDASRALTHAGRERVRQVASALREAGESAKWIVSSPLVRAVQTAEIVFAEQGHVATIDVEAALSPRGHLIEGGDAVAVVRRAARAGRKRMMIVGHEPDLTCIVETLTERPMPVQFTTAMVVGLRLSPDGKISPLRFVFDPRSLEFTIDQRSTT